MTKGYYGTSINTHPHGGTPNNIIESLTNEFGELFDPCPNNPTFDGLTLDWGLMMMLTCSQAVYVNPPYSRGVIGQWVKKAEEEAKKSDITVIMLIPSYTDTKYFHKHIFESNVPNEIRFIKGRLKFKGYQNLASFPSCLVIFNPKGE